MISATGTIPCIILWGVRINESPMRMTLQRRPIGWRANGRNAPAGGIR